MPTKCCICNVELALYDWSGRLDSPNLEAAVKIDGADFCNTCARKNSVTVDAEYATRELIQSVIVTTTPSLDGYRIAKVVDVISAECVFGMNLFKDFFMALSDIFGGRSGTSQKVLREARQLCIRELKTEAYQLGANAVIGVDLDYSEISGKNTSMLFLVASGTAVVLEKISAPLGVDDHIPSRYHLGVRSRFVHNPYNHRLPGDPVQQALSAATLRPVLGLLIERLTKCNHTTTV